MSLSIWGRANGRLGAMMVIAFTTWCAFLAWNFWVQVRGGRSEAATTVT